MAKRVDPERVSPSHLSLMGEILIDQNPHKAIELLRKSQSVHPQDYWINYFLALAYYTIKPRDLANAYHYASIAQSLAPDDPHIANFVGVLTAALGQRAEAINIFRRIVRKWPWYVPARANLVQAMLLDHDFEGASRTLDEIPPNLCRLPPMLVARADWLLIRGNPSESVLYYRQAQDADGGLAPESRINYGRALLLTGDIAAARAEAMKAEPFQSSESKELLHDCERAERNAARIKSPEQRGQ